MKKIDKNYFPGWVRKSISFTIDDGNLEMDKKFIDIVKPYGIKGTFNISNFYFDKLSPAGYRAFYEGYEIANHCKYHPYVFDDGVEYVIKDEPRPEHAESENTVYASAGVEGLFEKEYVRGWRNITDVKNYIRFTRECTASIKEVFGAQKIGFVWPFGRQNSAELFELLKKEPFYGIRQGGETEDKTNFAIPADRYTWSFNAIHSSLLSVAEKFKNYPDDGALKTFIFGAHSIDFENAEKWCDLEKFARDFGNRPEKYWYATNVEIFDYEDAVKALTVTDEKIENPTDIAVYVTVDGEKTVIPPHTEILF
ncbi:MAG: polysaccharide deacetylase family protein [Clostridia bacterium]|nr:polysaccharide deacetylase family protein [Clostridia bacterium]